VDLSRARSTRRAYVSQNLLLDTIDFEGKYNFCIIDIEQSETRYGGIRYRLQQRGMHNVKHNLGLHHLTQAKFGSNAVDLQREANPALHAFTDMRLKVSLCVSGGYAHIGE
jgi:hypothetical protein